jgi:hypothetical protein
MSGDDLDLSEKSGIYMDWDLIDMLGSKQATHREKMRIKAILKGRMKYLRELEHSASEALWRLFANEVMAKKIAEEMESVRSVKRSLKSKEFKQWLDKREAERKGDDKCLQS